MPIAPLSAHERLRTLLACIYVRPSGASAADAVYRHVKDRVLTGELEGGQMVSEGEVAAALEVSRTPVREAFLRLEVEGWLRLFPKRGALVVPVAPHEIDEVLDARALVEGHAAADVVHRPDDLARLLTALDEAIDAPAAGPRPRATSPATPRPTPSSTSSSPTPGATACSPASTAPCASGSAG